MSYDTVTFTGALELVARNYKWYPNRVAELNAIAAALATDPTTHDATMQKAAVGMIPGQRRNTPFTNDILLLVNTGKGGNLSNTAMSNAITSSLSQFIAPINTSLPLATGATTLSVTNGIWQYSPTSYTYQWLRGGTNIPGAVTQTYATVGADSGTNVSCRVTATNAAGSTPATSNAIAVP